MIEYTRDGDPTYHWDSQKGWWMRTRLYDFAPRITRSETLQGMNEEQGREWLLAHGWVEKPKSL